MSNQSMDITALQRRVIRRAWRDEKFRKELIKNPKAVLSREIAKLDPTASIPDDVNIRVVEETPSTFYLVLPNNPAEMADQMSEDDLYTSGIRQSESPSSVDIHINFAPSFMAAGSRRCKCHATWATLYD